MRQSSNITQREETAALLLRISRDDGEEGESNSIQNQRKLLTKAAKEMGYTNILEFPDDGISGTTMNRPGFKAMIKEIERGAVGAVFVKDLSRLGRNYREVGYYTEEFFPDHDIRFVSLSDGVDSAEGEDELAPFRNIMNECFTFSRIHLQYSFERYFYIKATRSFMDSGCFYFILISSFNHFIAIY